LRSIQKVVIERAEGLTSHYTMVKVTYSGDNAEEWGNQWLREIAQTAPEHGGYDKTDVWVTLSNGQEYEFRFDVMHFPCPTTTPTSGSTCAHSSCCTAALKSCRISQETSGGWNTSRRRSRRM
jgi:hypothetical protein